MKQCSRCKAQKPTLEFNKHGGTKDGLQKHCKSCRLEYRKNNKEKIAKTNKIRLLDPKNAIKNRNRAKLWNKNNPEKRRIIIQKNHYKRRYGLTLEQKQFLIDSQDSKCAICKNDLKSTHDVCVDHDHKTEIVRGILCRKCNLGIGHLNDSTDILKSAIMYLNKYKGEAN
jgi:hypothetical protein